MILTFAGPDSRLANLKILNGNREHRGGYLLTVSRSNLGSARLPAHLRVTGMPNPAALGRWPSS